MIVDNPERFEIGRVISRTFRVLGNNLPTFLALAGVLLVPMLAIYLLGLSNPLMGGIALGVRDRASQPQSYYIALVAATAVNILCSYTLKAALVQGTFSYLNEEGVSFGACLSTGVKSVIPIFCLAVMSYVAVILGFVLLVIPGIILMLSWAVVVPVRVVEQTSLTQSFGRSRVLTKGHRWKILGLFLIYAVLAGAVTLGTRPLFGISFIQPNLGSLSAAFLVVSWVVVVIESMIAAAGTASLYYELRLVKEGIAPGHLAEAFD